MAVTSAQVQELYVGLLGRAADKAGLDYWVGQLNKAGTTLSLENVRANFVNEQAEYKATFGSLTRAETVTQVYSNLFGRAPDAAGLTYWSTGAGASVNVDQLVVAFISAASTSDKQALTNKVVVSEVYSSTVGANFVKADAATIVSGVNANAATVSTALGKLTDGSLSGVAVPTGVAQLQAQAAAVKAQDDFKAAKAADLVKLNADMVAFAKTVKADDATVQKITFAPGATAKQQYEALDTGAPTTGLAKELADARLLVAKIVDSGALSSKTTAQLELDAASAVKDLNEARSKLTLAENGYAAKAAAYEAAVKLAATVKDVPTGANTAQDAAVQVLATATAVASADAKTALAKALVDVGVTSFALFDAASFVDTTAAATTLQAVYGVLADRTTTTQVKSQIDAALQNFSSYTAVKALAAQKVDFETKAVAASNAWDALDNVSAATANNTLESNYKALVQPATDAAKAVEASKAVDALAAQFKAIVDSNAALGATVTKAGADLGALTNLIVIPELTATATAVGGVNADGNASANDLFHFGAGVTGAKDLFISNAGSVGVKGVDSIYLGEGFVKGTATISATNKIVGGNDGVKEVFLFQKGNDTYVIAEAKTFASSTVGSAYTPSHTDDVATIVLTGVGIEQVSFANGVVTIA